VLGEAENGHHSYSNCTGRDRDGDVEQGGAAFKTRRVCSSHFLYIFLNEARLSVKGLIDCTYHRIV